MRGGFLMIRSIKLIEVCIICAGFCLLLSPTAYTQSEMLSSSASPQILFSPKPLYFGNIPEGSSAIRQLLIYNLGTADANISNLSIQGEHADFFTLKTEINSYTLKPLEILVLEIEFHPTYKGGRNAEFVMESNAPSSPDRVTLAAAGTEADASTLTFERIIGTREMDGGSAIKQTIDGGFIIVGSTLLPNEDYSDVYVVKTDGNGKVEWTNSYGGEDSDNARDVQCLDDGSFLVVGMTDSYGAGRQDIYLMKLNASGEKQWEKTYGGTFDDRPACFKKTTDGNYIIAGATKNTDNEGRNAYLLKIDAAGNEKWSKDYGGAGGETAKDILETDDGGFLVIGSTTSTGAGEFDVYLFKTDASGNVQWEKTYGGTNWEEGNSIQPTSDGGYIIAGFTVSQGAGARDFYLIKTDATGNMQWEKTYGEKHNDSASEVLQTDDGGYLLAGSTTNIITEDESYTDIFIVKTNSNGDVEWTTTYGGEKSEGVADMLPMDDGGFILVGSSGSYSKDSDIYLIRMSAAGRLIAVEKSEGILPQEFYLYQNYPNPFNNHTCIQFSLSKRAHVSIEIYNMFGQYVCTLIDQEKPAGSHLLRWDAGEMASGLYFYQLEAGEFNQKRRMILLK
ncbi:choice-of-anchor D domain-containing protein [candidate division KSB1 bacterium]|nr:choice-of-anchor D domain-containing protein [candidate division KSB1 bacterium]